MFVCNGGSATLRMWENADTCEGDPTTQHPLTDPPDFWERIKSGMCYFAGAYARFATPFPETWGVGCEVDTTDRVSGDPFTTHNGTRTQFWLPTETFVKLVKVNGFELRGMSRNYASGNHQQWLSDFLLMQDEQEIIRAWAMDPKALIAKKNAPKDASPPDTLGVAIVEQGHWHNMTQSTAVVGNGKVNVAFKQHTQRIGLGHKQAIRIKVDGITIRLFSSKANKFHSQADQIRYLHLDMDIENLDYAKATGTLPEIWGYVPMSKETVQMLEPPKAQITFNI